MKIYNPNIAPPAQRFADQAVKVNKTDDRQVQLDRLRKACRDFESIFITYLLKNMRQTTEESDLFGEGLGGDIYRDIFDGKLAETMAASNQLKIGEILFSRYAPIVEGKKAVKDSTSEIVKPEPIEIQPPQPDVTAAQIQPQAPPPEANPPGEEKSEPILTGIENIVHQAAKEFGISPGLIKAIIKHESAGNPLAVSSRGAKGLMQLLDSTATMLGVTDPFNPAQNIMGGAKYLSGLIKKFGGDLTKAIASYNAGPGAVEKYDGIPPYPETQRYVKNILATMMKE